MYPANFDYVRAGSVREAISLLQAHPEAKLLAGGHSLLPAMKLRLAEPAMLIDIGRIDELKGIAVREGRVHIGALTTHAMVAASAEVPAALAGAAGKIGDPQVRNRGTVGGNIAHADPASDLPTVFTALGARVHLAGPGGRRTVEAADFFVDLFQTALQPGEVVTSIELPAAGRGNGSAYAKLANPASRYAMVGAAATVTLAGGRCTAAGVAVGGLTATATRARAVEAALVGKVLDTDTIAAAAAAVAADLGDNVSGDIHASAEYRRAMAPVMVKRAISAAVAQAGA